jgi:hypothetical protein
MFTRGRENAHAVIPNEIGAVTIFRPMTLCLIQSPDPNRRKVSLALQHCPVKLSLGMYTRSVQTRKTTINQLRKVHNYAVRVP